MNNKQRKNQSKYKKPDYVKQLIKNALSFGNVDFIEIKQDYAYFICEYHGNFKKRLDHLTTLTHHVCPKCSKQVYAKKVGQILARKHKMEDYVDLTQFIPLEEYKTSRTLTKFKCIKHNEVFTAKPERCFGCDLCKKEHHYKWKKDWKHIDQEEIIRRCKKVHPEYDYSLVNYVNATSLLDIICPKHGIFRMSYANLTNKTKPQSCPFCSKMGTHKISKMTKQVLAELDSRNIKYKTEEKFPGLKDKKVLPIDIYLPDYNAVIECQGVQHFRFVKSFSKTIEGFKYIQKHDKMKFDYFQNSNIKLYYYTTKYNKDVIPDNYFDYVYTDIVELINAITK